MPEPVLETRTFQPPPLALERPLAAGRSERSDPWDAIASRALIHRVRWHTGLSQAEFADAFCIDPGHLQALERGSVQPDSALVAYLTVIDRAPDAVRAALSRC